MRSLISWVRTLLRQYRQRTEDAAVLDREEQREKDELRQQLYDLSLAVANLERRRSPREQL